MGWIDRVYIRRTVRNNRSRETRPNYLCRYISISALFMGGDRTCTVNVALVVSEYGQFIRV